MRKTLLLLLFAGYFAVIGSGEKKARTRITVRAVTHERKVNAYTSTYTTPGTSNTNCDGSATTAGNTTVGTANCRTTSTPAQVHQNTSYTVDITDVVEANGQRYTITCRANWARSKCGPMIDGDSFPAEIDGNTMWITAHRGGNQGPETRIKYRILDIRAVPVDYKPMATVPASATRSSALTNADVLALKDAGLSDQLIVEKIRSSSVNFDLEAANLVALKKAGLADAVISSMLEASRR